MMRTPTLSATGAPRQRGFTAVEITMVAAIIAILTLIALPLFRQRIEQARYNGCLDEMSSIAKAQELVHAETGWYFRLNDLDNTQQYNPASTSAPLDVPMAIWNRPLTLGALTAANNGERGQLATGDNGWNGPYMSYRKFVYLDELVTKFNPHMLRRVDTANPDGRRGAILILSQNLATPPVDIITPGASTDKYPLDPWGNPYIFFGYGALDSASADPNEARMFYNCAIYSMGPNGLPGTGAGTIDSTNFWRYPIGSGPTNGGPFLGDGSSDDLTYEF